MARSTEARNSETSPIETSLGIDAGGWHVEWFQEDPNTPMGFRTARWYGSLEDCETRMTQPSTRLHPAVEHEVMLHARAE
jgi:hypothetical protein